jgi:trehalose/maltose transport system permease protein
MATQTQTVSATVRRPGLRGRLDLGSGLLPYYLVIPTIVVILVVAVYPIFDSIWLSMLDNPASPVGSTFVGLQHYSQLFADSVYRGAIVRTIVFTIISVALECILGLGVALLINKTFPGRGLVRAAILVPWAFPTIVSAYIWQLMYNDQTGVISYFLQGIHLLKPGGSLLETPNGVVTAAVVTDVWKTTPFMALLILAGLQVIPGELYEAASVDGSSRWQQFWTITLPMIKNVLLIALLFRTLDAVRVFDLFYAFGARLAESMGSNAFFLMFAGTAADFGPGLASAVVIFVLGIIVSLIFVSQMRGVLSQQG